MKRKIVSAVLVCILLLITINPVFAVTSSEYRKQAEDAKNKSEEAKEDLEKVEGQINKALQEVEDVNNSIESVEKEVSELTTQIEGLKKSISEKEKDLADKKKILEERLVVSYMNGNNTYLDALLSGGIFKFVTNYETIKQIAEYDNNLMQEVENTKNELESEKTKIESAKEEKEKKSEELKTLKQEKEQKVNSLTEEQKNIQSQIEEYDKKMKELEKKEKEQAAKEAEEARRKAAATSSGSLSNTSGSSTANVTSTGQFLWPVPSSHRISSPYGYRIHPISGTRKLHAGTDIAAAGGANILAADSGTVILSSFGYNGGYGNYIIISHGNGVTTRYAHCSNLFVSVGQTVTKGQVIAAVGSTGASTGNHLHFEVRINGESKDPMNYL